MDDEVRAGRPNNITGAIHLNGRTLTFDLPSSLVVSGSIDGSGAIVKGGNEPLTLSGANTYTGPTTVRGAWGSKSRIRQRSV